MVTISENIIIGETISHDAKSILRGVRHPFIWKKGLWYGITTSCMFFRQERCGRSFIKITIYDCWE